MMIIYREHLGSWRCRCRWPVALTALLASRALLAAEMPLDLAEAEALALLADPAVEQLQARADALRERAISSAQLPDPKLKLGAVALPIDSFDLDQEPMTQLQIGIQQRFPPGAMLKLRGQRFATRAAALTDQEIDQRLLTLRSVREDYLEALYQRHAGRIVGQARSLFENLLTASTDSYATGRGQQQDVFRAELELSRLDDRATRIAQAQEMARASLAFWIGQAAYRPLANDWPRLAAPASLEKLSQGIDEHPRIRSLHQLVLATELGVDAARQQYKPGWMLDVTYGDRTGQNLNGSARSDFLTAMVTIDLPVFRARRQDRELAASSKALDANHAARRDGRRQLQRSIDRAWAAQRRLDQRLALFADRLLPQAQDNSNASLAAYQSGVVEFTTLVRARIIQYELELDYARARIDQMLARVQLLYLAGDRL